MVPITYNLRSLAARKATTPATAAGIALVVFVFSCLLMFTNGLKKTLGSSGRADNAVLLQTGADVELSSNIEESSLAAILGSTEIARTGGGVPIATSEIVAVILLERAGGKGLANVQLRGTREGVAAFRPDLKIIEGRAAVAGTDEAIVGKGIHGRFKGLEVGQSFEVAKGRPVRVVGVFEERGSSFESEVWLDLDLLRAAFGRPGLISSARVRLASPSQLAALQADIAERAKGVEVVRESVYYARLSGGSNVLVEVVGMVVALLFCLAAILGAAITMQSSIEQRRREIALLRALGFSRASVLFSFLLESMALAAVGGAVGALASIAMGRVHLSLLNAVNWSEIVFSFEPTPGIILGSVALAASLGLVGGFFPAVRAARISPVEGMRSR